MFSASRFVSFVVVLSFFAAAGCHRRVRAMNEQSTKIMATNNAGEIRGLCFKPEKHRGQFGWNHDAAGQSAACEWLDGKFLEGMATAETEARAQGGFACLKRLDQQWRDTEHAVEWRRPVESPEKRLELLSKAAEPCVVELEGKAKSAEPTALFLALMGKEQLLTSHALTPAQQARLAPLATQVPQAAATAWEARAGKLQEQPLAAALYLSGAAVAAHAAKNTSSRDALVKRAQDLLSAVGAADKLTVTLTGDLADRVISAAEGKVHFGEKGELQLKLELAAPSLEFGQREVTLHGTHSVRRGTKPNPNFLSAQRDCKKQEAEAVREEKSCRNSKNNFAGVCDWARRYRERTTKCQEQLTRMNQQVEDVVDERVDYGATEFFGKGSGTLTLTPPGGPAKTVPVSGGLTKARHGAVPLLGLDAAPGGKVTPEEVTRSYQSNAVAAVVETLTAASTHLAVGLLDQAKGATEASECATALVRSCLVTGHAPRSEVLAAQDDKLGLPTARALAALLSSRSKTQRFSW